MMEIGKITDTVLKQSVLKNLKLRRKEVLCGAGVGTDCAVLCIPDGYAIATCMQEGVLPLTKIQDGYSFQKAYSAAKRIMVRIVNNLACSMSEPLAAEVCLLIPETLEYEFLRDLMRELETEARAFDMDIIGGQTRVLAGITEPILVLTGYGIVTTPSGQLPGNGYKPGRDEDVIVVGTVGLEGTAYFAEQEQNRIRSRYPERLLDRAAVNAEELCNLTQARIAIKEGATYLHDVSEGGILRALWELGERGKVGLDIKLRQIPILQETVEIAEICGVNPYELLSGGCMLITAPNGEDIVEKLTENGFLARVIGRTTGSQARVIDNGEEVGYINRPAQDEVYRKRG